MRTKSQLQAKKFSKLFAKSLDKRILTETAVRKYVCVPLWFMID
jgi:hypothetical protein